MAETAEIIKPCAFLRENGRCGKFLDMPSKMELETGEGFCIAAGRREEQVGCFEFKPSLIDKFSGIVPSGGTSRSC